MPKLVPLKPNEVVRKLRRLGFEGPFPGGKHKRMVNFSKKKIVPIPFHKGRDVSIGVIREIIKEIGVSREEWIKV